MKDSGTNEGATASPIEMKDVAISAMQDPDFVMLEHINWSVAPGEFWVFGAPQHSGKTDFLLTTAGLIPPAAGKYKFFGNETRIFDESRLADRLRIGFVFEAVELFPYLTVAENVALPLRYNRNLSVADGIAAIDALLEATELKPIADVMPASLPRSWHKRTWLARALVLQPEVLLADNPLGALDARHSRWWLRFLDSLSRGHPWFGERPLTIVVTTDDFRPWRGGHRHFALLKDKNFISLGAWHDVLASNEPLVKELLVEVEKTGELKD